MPSLFSNKVSQKTASEQVVLTSGRASFLINRTLLLNSCSYFKGLFNHGWRESEQAELDFSGTIEPQSLKIFVDFNFRGLASISSLAAAVSLLEVCHFFYSHEGMRSALEFIGAKLSPDTFKRLIDNPKELPPLEPFILNFKLLCNTFAHRAELEVFQQVAFKALLCFESYQTEMQERVLNKLIELTNTKWLFDGIRFSSEVLLGGPFARTLTDDSSSLFCQSVLNLLSEQGILSIQYDPLYLDGIGRGTVKVLNSEGFLGYNCQQVHNEIAEAANLINNLVTKFISPEDIVCKSLFITCKSRLATSLFEALELSGCISMNSKVHYRVSLGNFDLIKLRYLKEQSISPMQLIQRSRKVDKSKDIFFQLCTPPVINPNINELIMTFCIIDSKKVRFSVSATEELITQLTGFSSSFWEYDDLPEQYKDRAYSDSLSSVSCTVDDLMKSFTSAPSAGRALIAWLGSLQPFIQNEASKCAHFILSYWNFESQLILTDRYLWNDALTPYHCLHSIIPDYFKKYQTFPDTKMLCEFFDFFRTRFKPNLNDYEEYLKTCSQRSICKASFFVPKHQEQTPTRAFQCIVC